MNSKEKKIKRCLACGLPMEYVNEKKKFHEECAKKRRAKQKYNWKKKVGYNQRVVKTYLETHPEKKKLYAENKNRARRKSARFEEG